MLGTAGGALAVDVRSGRRPVVVVWEADGSPFGGLGYGHAITTRLAEAGIPTTTVPLTRRTPSDDELAAPVHVLSGGSTPVTSSRPWVRSARRALEPVLARALAGRATVTGICFGAQLIAATLAGPGAVGPNPRGLEAGLTLVRPPGRRAGVVVSQIHYHCIEPSAVAAVGGEIILSNGHTAVQGFTVGPTITGLQFHPELDPTAARATVSAHRDLMRAHGTTSDAALASIEKLATRWRTDPFDHYVARPARSAR